MDTPKGLLVPVVRNIQDHSIISLGAEIERLTNLAKEGKLSPKDLTGATFTVSNIGSIGGDVVAPVIVPPMVGIMAIGRVHEVLVLQNNTCGGEKITKKENVVLSWSADHRVLDGATVARCAQRVQKLLENVDSLDLTLE